MKNASWILALLLAVALPAAAQLPAPNAEGVSTGHTHLVVPDAEAARSFWKAMGAVEKSSGRLQLLQFPGMYILLREGEPAVASTATTANHIGFMVKDYLHYKDVVLNAGATIFFEDPETGQVLADLPWGLRVEFAQDAEQPEPIVFHHTHLSSTDIEGLRDWYLTVFGAEAGERRGLPSALVPGGRVDFMPAAQGETPKPSQGSAIDHIGFEVADMDTFAARMDRLGIPFDRAPERRDDINLTIAFITDPAGTYIEITQGLFDVE
jgi:catechol 2,3-dioxygenase-like lactoylglutathione lyase family enzyme